MEQEPLRVGLVGYGAIGQAVTRLVEEQAVSAILLVGALVRRTTLKRPSGSPKIVETLSALLAEHPHVIVEVAGHEGLREHGPAILSAGVDLILVSIGALADPTLFKAMLEAAESGNAQAKIASGAIGALDALSAASLGTLTRVTHTMRKSPEALLPAAEVEKLTTPYEVFRGNARQAVKQFPEFLNVAAAVALAGKGFDETEVIVLADPATEHSLHEVVAEGAFGVFRFEIENAPISLPAHGAKLVAMSIVRSLLLRRASLVIG
jgi:aspartate dehydrogenase